MRWATRDFTAKSLNRQSKKCIKDTKTERTRLKKAIKEGNMAIARVYASNVIRNEKDAVDLAMLSSRVSAIANRVQRAMTMQRTAGSLGNMTRGLDRAMESMNLEMITKVMDKLESQFEDLDVQTEYMGEAISGATAVSTPQDDIDTLMQQVADEAGLELNQELNVMEAPQELPKEEELTERLARLRNSS
ncbi:hypothetical protein EV175_005113 [Coemansia sp. RSA 1933]|nr:hypothetical protein EV175_005113 [Coemansia sp. RSA 1933]